jgi:hypothetical protein
MIQINDLVNYNQQEYKCWFIEEINGETYYHIINEDGTIGFCVLSDEIIKLN